MTDIVMQQIAAAIKRLTGLNIEPEKYYLFEHRFPEVMREFMLPDFSALLAEIHRGANMRFISRIIEKITTHETRFFRDESIFDALSEQIIPEWKERSAIVGETIEYPPLKIWSAACSTGQEVYSIAMMIAEHHPQIAKKTHILGTDISEESVARAENGFFTEFEVSRGLPEKFKKKYFTTAGSGVKVNKGLLPGIEFKTMNLVQDAFTESHDIVFCRNVAYYFATDTRAALFSKMRSAVKKNGVLILGSAESLDGSLNDYVLREFGLARYYEVNNENVTIFARKRN